MADVFLSYSRRDSEFVGRLAQSIEEHGKEVWLDVEGIADGEVFPEAIKRAIEQSDAFVFVITPASVASSYCENEVEYAREMQKRIVPVLRDPVADAELPPEIRDRNWIPFTEEREIDAALARLVGALDTDLEAAKAHTRWLVKALEWDGERREKSFLLRGSELASAEKWLASSPEDADPAPTALQREYVLASRESAARRQRMLVGASLAVAVVSVGLLVFALISRSQAVSEKVSANAQALAAESQAQLSNDPEISLILAMRAVRERPTPESLFALRAALDASPFQRALPTVASPGNCGLNSGLSAAVSPDGRQVVEAACNGSLLLVNAATGRVVHHARVGAPIAAVAFSPSGSLLAVAAGSQVLLVNPSSGTVERSLSLAPRGRVALSGGPGLQALAFSPDGRELAAGGYDAITLAALPSLRERSQTADPEVGSSIVFTPDGKQLLVGAADNGSFSVFDAMSGRLVRRVSTGNATQSWAEVLALNADGSELAVGYPNVDNGNGSVAVYRTRNWTKEFDLTTIPSVEISAVALSPDGTRLAIGAEDGTAEVWSLVTREQLTSFAGPTAAVTTMAFTDGGRSVLTASNDGTVRVWRASGPEQSFVAVDGAVNDVSVAHGLLRVLLQANGKGLLATYRLPGGQQLRKTATPSGVQGGLSDDGRYAYTYVAPNAATGVPVRGPVRIYSLATDRVVKVLAPSAVFAAAISPDDSRLFLRVVPPNLPPNGIGQGEVVTIANGHVVQLQQAEPCGAFPSDIAFAAKDSRIAGGSFCGIVDVWNAKSGRLLRQINEGGEISSVDLSPDGSRLLVGSWDSRATIWSVASGHPVVELIGDTRGIGDAGFAADGSLVVTSALDHTVRVWNARTGQQLRVLSFSGYQNIVDLNPDGYQFAVGSTAAVLGAEDTLRVFNVCPACQNPKALLALAAPLVTTRLTTVERTVVENNGS
jgi:WD40 repeat protein